MSIDNSDATATVEDSTSTATETVQSAPAQADTQTSDAPAVETTREADSDHIPITPDRGSEASLTPPDTVVPQNTQQPTADEVAKYKAEIETYKKRTADKDNYIRQLSEHKKRYEGIDPNDIRQFNEEKARKAQEALHKWNKNHPAHSQFLESRRRMQDYNKAMAQAPMVAKESGITLEQAQDAINRTHSAFLTESDVQDYKSWEAHQRGVQEELATNPEEFVVSRTQDLIKKEIKQHYEEIQQKAAAEATVGGWFNDPANKPIVETMAPAMKEMLDRLGGTDEAWKFTQAMAQKEYKIQQLEAQLGASRNHDKEADKHVAAADERTRLLQNKAAITRDSTLKRVLDPQKLAKERGIKPGSKQYVDLLAEMDSRGEL